MNRTHQTLAANILKYRKQCGLTQEALAQKLNLSFQTISKWENAKAVPDALILPRLADIFSCSVDDLFSYASRPKLFYKIPEDYVHLWQLAEQQRKDLCASNEEENSNKQVIVIEAKGNCPVLLFVNDGIKRDEEAEFLQEIAENNIVVKKILCMWSDGSIDLPSYNLRDGLSKLSPENATAEILLMGTAGFKQKKLGDTLIC